MDLYTLITQATRREQGQGHFIAKRGQEEESYRIFPKVRGSDAGDGVSGHQGTVFDLRIGLDPWQGRRKRKTIHHHPRRFSAPKTYSTLWWMVFLLRLPCQGSKP